MTFVETHKLYKSNEADSELILLGSLNRSEDQLPPYDVAIAPEMVSRLEDCLQQLNLEPVNLRNASGSEINLLVSKFQYFFCWC